MEQRVHYRKLMLYHRIVNSDDERTIKKIIEFQKDYDREGTWYHDVKHLCSLYNIQGDAAVVLKSVWKKEVKAKIEAVNKEQVTNACKSGVKTRFVCDDEWGRKEYLNVASVENIRRLLKYRLCMVPLPCNQRSKYENPGCTMCGETKKIRMEHYFHCEHLQYLRYITNIVGGVEEFLQGTLMQMLKGTVFMDYVSKMVVY